MYVCVCVCLGHHIHDGLCVHAGKHIHVYYCVLGVFDEIYLATNGGAAAATKAYVLSDGARK